MTDEMNRRLERLERQTAALEAKEEIRSLMGRYQKEASRGLRQELYDRFWSAREDTSLEVGASGVFKGARNAAAYYQKDPEKGVFQTYVLGEPEICLGPDGETACGIWQAIGVELDAGELNPGAVDDPERRKLWTSRTADGKSYRAEWLVRKLSVELRRESGEWRFWRVQVLELLRCPMDSDFVAWAEQRFATDGPRLDELFHSNLPFAPGQPPERMADEPTTRHWQYTWQSDAIGLP